MQNEQMQKEISLLEVIKILLKKWIIVLSALVIGVFAGAGIGFSKNYNKTYYGTTVVFYVNPVKKGVETEGLPVQGSYGENITATMVALLESEYFARLILEGITVDNQKIEAEIEGQPNPQYFNLLKNIQAFTTYADKDPAKSSETKQPNNLFYAQISVLNDEAFAQILLDRIIEEGATFIESSMHVPSGYDTTKCETISVNHQIHRLNEDTTLSDMVKYGLVCGVATTLLGCVVALIVDKVQKTKKI